VLFFRSRWFGALVFAGALSLGASGSGQATTTAPVAASAGTAAAAEMTYPEIVRIRAVEGDVRISRMDDKGKATGEWEQAVDDVPVETGFNLVTGDGRAEIEFEDASTLYLDKNSALSFDDLHSTNGVPHTEVSLLTGTCTAYLHPGFAGEMFVVKTPTDRVRVVYPNRVYERITAYLDAIAITHLQEPNAAAKGKAAVAAVTAFHNNGKAVEPEGENDPAAFAEWDAWVAGRVALHEEDAKDVAESSGLPDSTPGLADMEDRGVFFSCAPYGTCWEPTPDAGGRDDGQVAPPSPVGQGPEFRPKLRPSAVSITAGDALKTKVSAVALQGFADPVGFTVELPQGFTCAAVCSGQLLPGEAFDVQLASAADVPVGSYTVPVTLSSGPLTHVVFLKIYVGLEEDADFVPVGFGVDAGPIFPCGPGGFPPHLPARTPRGVGRYGGAPGYAWAVCHTGAWIYRAHRYVWVIDKRKHHHPHPGPPRPPHHPRSPIRWIKCKGKDVWVPRHPDDVDGKLPVNWKHVAFRPVGKKGPEREAVKLEPKDIVEPLEEAPKEFRDLPRLGLVKAEAPILRAYETKDRLAGNKLAGGSELRFDRGTHSFLLAHEVREGGKTRVVTESLEQHRIGAAGVGGGAHGGGTVHEGGGAHAASGGSHSSGSHAGGGSHSGGGGGSHASAPASHH